MFGTLYPYAPLPGKKCRLQDLELLRAVSVVLKQNSAQELFYTGRLLACRDSRNGTKTKNPDTLFNDVAPTGRLHLYLFSAGSRRYRKHATAVVVGACMAVWLRPCSPCTLPCFPTRLAFVPRRPPLSFGNSPLLSPFLCLFRFRKVCSSK